MRSLADQSEAELGGSLSILVRQKRDHQRLDQLLHHLEVATDREREDEVLHAINRLVFPHAFAEESVIWPEVRRLLPDGEALTLQVEREHQEVNELVVALESGELDDDARRTTIARLVAVLREDVRDEEDAMLPRLQAVLSPQRLRRLGLAWEAVRRAAPTRPHPVVARRPPGNALAALPLSVLDRSRDGLDLAARRWPASRGAAVAASRTAARAAGALERLPAFRRGEDPSTSR